MQTHVQATLSASEGRALLLALAREVKAQGLMVPATSRTLCKLGLLVPALAAALALAWLGRSWLELGAGYLGLTLLLAQLAFVGHEAGHGSVSARASVNRLVGQLCLTLFTGLAFDEWTARHHAHHRFCQDERRDPDMMVGWVASLTDEARRSKEGLGRFMTRYQGVHLWLFSWLFGHSQRLLSQLAVLREARVWSLDALLLGPHFALWFGVPCGLLGVSLQSALCAYLIPVTLLGPYLAAIFWVNHIGMPLVREPERFSFLEHQAITSRTITNPAAWNWFFGGLNFQIEHHLFPRVPSVRLPALQAVVRRHFADHDLPYHGVSWWSALRSIAAHLRQVAT